MTVAAQAAARDRAARLDLPGRMTGATMQSATSWPTAAVRVGPTTAAVVGPA
jgi:hypothetical protein